MTSPKPAQIFESGNGAAIQSRSFTAGTESAVRIAAQRWAAQLLERGTIQIVQIETRRKKAIWWEAKISYCEDADQVYGREASQGTAL